MVIKNKNWEFYIARPFSLFGVSLWYECYASKWCRQIIGKKISNCLMIEYPKGVARYYRDKDEQKSVPRAFDDLALKNTDKLINLFKKGLTLNKRALLAIKKNNFNDLKSAVEFLVELFFVGTILPFRSGDTLINTTKDKKIFNLVKKLRLVSYYGQIIDKVVAPLALEEFNGSKNREEINFVTLNEIIKKKKIKIAERISKSRNGKFFIYQNLNGTEKIDWVKDPTSIIEKIEKTKTDNEMVSTIKGNIACRGLARGRARLILTNKIKVIDFNKGDILVAGSTSPALMSLIKKCGAIVTDEGGLICHAAIISRELKIPCVIGTRIATKVLKNGDEVEVDANNGIVKILNRKK